MTTQEKFRVYKEGQKWYVEAPNLLMNRVAFAYFQSAYQFAMDMRKRYEKEQAEKVSV